MNPYESGLPVIYLRPGEMHFTERPTLVVTVLGSCLSVIMFNRRRSIGAISHSLLPRCDEDKGCGDCGKEFKYVECSIQEMLRLFGTFGIARSEIEVKIFGGADTFSARRGKSAMNVGKQNIRAALDGMERERIAVAAFDVGGGRGRKLFFNTQTGGVLLKRLSRANDIDIRW